MSSPRHLRLALLGTLLTVGTVLGCSRAPTPKEFQKLAVSTLIAQAAQEGIALTDVACETPGGVGVGTVFTCTAAGEAGERFAYNALIDADDHVVLSPA